MDNPHSETTTDAPNADGALIPGEVETVSGRKFGTFQGVFRPTILTILGVMMYLREGWLVGNAGLGGAILVILTAYVITGTTALSLASITTNIRVGSGGAFSIISQSLGLEVGGSIGIPLYLAQGLSAAMYMYGFLEGWRFLFPEHHPALVLLVVFVVTFALSYTSAGLAFRVQILILLCVIVALSSMFLGVQKHELQPSWALWGNFADGGFWALFAVFFPASTGIMVGASMSGNLASPRRSIPRGTMAAWFGSLLVYLALTFWYASIASPSELRTDMTISMQRAYWTMPVVIGVMASCFSAGLSSLVAAPRVLQALGANKIVPKHEMFARLRNGEPRNASLFTGLLCALTLALGDLNRIATVLTMFFLMTYFTVNVVLVIEHYLGLISFRPQFRVPKAVPIVGSVCSLTAIVIINPVVGMVAVGICIAIYGYLDAKKLESPWETVHSGLFLSIANWAAKRAFLIDTREMKRSWKPDFLVPIERQSQLEGYFRLLRALAYSQGSVQVIGFRPQERQHEFRELPDLIQEFQREDLFASAAVVEARDYGANLANCVAVMNGSFFKPNTIFAAIDGRSDDELRTIVRIAKENTMGVVLFAAHPDAGLGRERTVNLWVRDQSPDWHLGLKLANLDYAVLMGYQLQTNWQAQLRLMSVVREEKHVDGARCFLQNLMELARMSRDIEILVESGEFRTFASRAPRADLNIFGLSEKPEREQLESLMQQMGSSCLFVLDSGIESALA